MNVILFIEKSLKKIKSKLRAYWVTYAYGLKIKSIGGDYLIRGEKLIKIGVNTRVMRGFWIEAVQNYDEKKYYGVIDIGDCLRASNNVHIASINSIKIGRNCLIGSNVTIIDHNHGKTKNFTECDLNIPPFRRPLISKGGICIGDNCWLADGVIVLADTIIGDNCIIGAGTVVQGIIPNNSIVFNKKNVVIGRIDV